MGLLLFTTDGELHEQTRSAEPRVVARVLEQGDARTRLLCGSTEHEIVPSASRGPAFELHDLDGWPCGGFEPFRLRRGGRLRVREVAVALHGRPWSHEGWVLCTPDGSRVDATVTSAADGCWEHARTGASVDCSMPFAVVLDPVGGVGPAEELPVALELLALGCWLISRWHRRSPGDHVLATLAAA